MILTDVVVVNYQTPGDLATFCRSLDEQAGIGTITIVNNAPTMEDVRIAADAGARLGGRVMNWDDNIGYAKAVNAAAAEVSSPVLGIFNADVICPPGSIAAMAEFLDAHDEVGVAGPKQVDSRQRITHAGITGSPHRPILRGWHQRDHRQFDDVRLDCVSVSGSAYFVKRSCWDELTNCQTYQNSVKSLTGRSAEGAFLPTAHYYEETFCSYHARAHDWKIAYNGRATMVHQWQGATRDQGLLTRYATESRRLFRSACADHGMVHD